jgi:hypothetical protein
MGKRFNFFGRFTNILLIGLGTLSGFLLGANHVRPPVENQSQVLNTLGLLNQKLDQISSQTESIANASRSVAAESQVTELPAIQLNGGSIKLRFKLIGEKYHYECSIEGGIDAITRLIAPNGQNALLKATFLDKDNFDVTDLTLSGQDFAIKEQGEGGKDLALNEQGVWENKVDPTTIKNWRIEVMGQDNTDNKIGGSPSPSPSAQVQNLAADITVHPTTGQLLLPESLQGLQDRIAQATPAPTPSPTTPVFQGPPKDLPAPRALPVSTPAPSPDQGGKVEDQKK